MKECPHIVLPGGFEYPDGGDGESVSRPLDGGEEHPENGEEKEHQNHDEEAIDQEIDYVITVCDKAKQTCPFFPGGKEVSHHSFEDPSQAEGTDEEKFEVFRRVRDEIKKWIDRTFGGDED